MEHNMLFFSERMMIADIASKWFRDNNVANCPDALIGYLAANKLMDIASCKTFLYGPDNAEIELSNEQWKIVLASLEMYYHQETGTYSDLAKATISCIEQQLPINN